MLRSFQAREVLQVLRVRLLSQCGLFEVIGSLYGLPGSITFLPMCLQKLWQFIMEFNHKQATMRGVKVCMKGEKKKKKGEDIYCESPQGPFNCPLFCHVSVRKPWSIVWFRSSFMMSTLSRRYTHTLTHTQGYRHVKDVVYCYLKDYHSCLGRVCSYLSTLAAAREPIYVSLWHAVVYLAGYGTFSPSV